MGEEKGEGEPGSGGVIEFKISIIMFKEQRSVDSSLIFLALSLRKPEHMHVTHMHTHTHTHTLSLSLFITDNHVYDFPHM